MNKKEIMATLGNQKYQWIVTLSILFIVLMMSSTIRLSNWDLLTDHTTGEKIPLALDPYYFLRVAETIVETGGDMPEFDEMRIPGFDREWHHEIMPQIVVWMWEVSPIFGNYSLQAVNIFSPVLFFGIGLLLFFVLAYLLTKSKFAAILATTFLAFSPAYLYRTMAGFSDHEAIGMVAFFGAMIVYLLALKYLDSTDGKSFAGSGLFGIALGSLTALTIATWGGVSVFLFMIIPIGFLVFWVVKMKDKKSLIGNSGILFYICWIIFTIVFATILGSNSLIILNRFLSNNGIISFVVLGFVVLDRLLMVIEDKIKSNYYDKKNRNIYTLGLLSLVGILALPLVGRNFFDILWTTLNKLLNPLWNVGRLTITVAENSQPYLVNWISNFGEPLFFLFILGIIFIAIQFSSGIRPNKNRAFLILGFLAMSFGILFSRISSASILNGNGIFSISGLVYLGGIGLFVYAFLKAYAGKIEIDPTVLVLFSWMFVMLVTGRSTTRLFFAIAPFMCLSSAYAIVMLFKYYRKKNLDDIVKVLIISLIAISLVLSGIIINSSYLSISSQAQHTGPSANAQWQSAMEWVRENTTEDSIFSHWWDYGYWVQTLGERATLSDGGQPQGVYSGNHKTARYMLTTTNPDSALSFFKTMNVDYLLIDQTDLGKYPAYSKIGGGSEGSENDRYSAIPVMLADEKQTQETANGTTVVFSGGMYLFEDISYNKDGINVFLPAGKAAVVGIVISVEENVIKQPVAVYVYNNIQTRIPIRYVYMNGEIVDYGSGLDAIIDIIPSFTGNSINPMGAAIYLSQKVSKSLFARMFLMDDVFGEYESLKLAHTEDNPIIASLKSQGVPLGDFVYYQGFRGPIKIWDVSDIPEEIKVVEEFRGIFDGTYGTLDGLSFK